MVGLRAVGISLFTIGFILTACGKGNSEPPAPTGGPPGVHPDMCPKPPCSPPPPPGCGVAGKPPCCGGPHEPACPLPSLPSACILAQTPGEEPIELFVGGLNHRTKAPGGNIENEGTQEIYQKIRTLWHAPNRVLIGFSGCLPQGFPQWDACTRIGDQLKNIDGTWSYTEVETTKWKSGDPLDDSAHFVTIGGSDWHIDNSKFVRFPVDIGRTNDEDGFMYSEASKAFDGATVTLPFYVIRNDTDDPAKNQRQMLWIVSQLAPSQYRSGLLPPIIVGDYNAAAPGPAYSEVEQSGFTWLTYNATCINWPKRAQPMLYSGASHLINVSYANTVGAFRCSKYSLIPTFIRYDSQPDGTPLYPSAQDVMQVPDSAHGLAQVNFDIRRNTSRPPDCGP